MIVTQHNTTQHNTTQHRTNTTAASTSSTSEVIDDGHAGYLQGIIDDMENEEQTLLEHFQDYHSK